MTERAIGVVRVFFRGLLLWFDSRVSAIPYVYKTKPSQNQLENKEFMKFLPDFHKHDISDTLINIYTVSSFPLRPPLSKIDIHQGHILGGSVHNIPQSVLHFNTRTERFEVTRLCKDLSINFAKV